MRSTCKILNERARFVGHLDPVLFTTTSAEYDTLNLMYTVGTRSRWCIEVSTGDDRAFLDLRVVSPAAGRRRAKRQQRALRKDDRQPTGLVGPSLRRRRIQSSRRRSSVMPDWYPRTPLRDITAIVHAYERRRLRVQAVRRAAQLNQAGETSTENPQESSVTTDQNSHTDSTPVRVIP
ncbi:uncharacterized protein A4U43_UnF8370, partial [Asparagus officinalis]